MLSPPRKMTIHFLFVYVFITYIMCIQQLNLMNDVLDEIVFENLRTIFHWTKRVL